MAKKKKTLPKNYKDEHGDLEKRKTRQIPVCRVTTFPLMAFRGLTVLRCPLYASSEGRRRVPDSAYDYALSKNGDFPVVARGIPIIIL
jgi:hypothetical protein